MGIRDAQGRWLLVNASPDLPAQIEACPDLQPSPGSPRNSPIAGIVLTNADLDHVLGVLSLREGSPLTIHATAAVRQTLDRCLGLTGLLDAFCGARWLEPPTRGFGSVTVTDGVLSGLEFQAIELPGKAPPFARGSQPTGVHSIALRFRDKQTGGRLLVAPDVGAVTKELVAALAESDAVLFDGTFWSSTELATVKPNAPDASGMGHLPIRDGGLELLGRLKARTRVYIHINNTNPALDPGSPERAAINAAGILVGSDGMEFEL